MPHANVEMVAIQAYCTLNSNCWVGLTSRWAHRVPGKLQCRSSTYFVTGTNRNMGGRKLDDRANGPWAGADGTWGTGNPNYNADTNKPWRSNGMCQTDFTPDRSGQTPYGGKYTGGVKIYTNVPTGKTEGQYEAWAGSGEPNNYKPLSGEGCTHCWSRCTSWNDMPCNRKYK